MLSFLAALMLAAPSGPKAKTADAKKPAVSVRFRCKHLQAYSNPDHVLCQREVVLLRDDLLLCCERFEGYTNEAGDFNRLVCVGDVRAQKGDELIWSEKATYLLDVEDIILTGDPLLIRGKSSLKGRRIVLEPDHDQAQVEDPYGMLALKKEIKAGKIPKQLPRSCPLDAKPKS